MQLHRTSFSLYTYGVILRDFLEKQGTEASLAELVGRVLTGAVKNIQKAIMRHGGGFAGSKNASGEEQLALDVEANGIVLDALKKSGLVERAASEEMEREVIWKAETEKTAKRTFTVVFDPIDGSSLADVNFAVGSIFGVYKAGSPIGRIGDEQLAAAYAVYGPRTTLVLTVRHGVHEFRLAEDGEFCLSKENLKIAEEAKHFAPGNLRAAVEREDYLRLTEDWIKSGLTLRYSGGMVPDLNHIFLKGNGIFTYPGYSKAPSGKLRLLFECNPMALLAEQALGAASGGHDRILNQKITELHQRTPIFIGSKNAVSEAEKLYDDRH